MKSKFIKLPKALFDDAYIDLSCGAKLLYSLLLDRRLLSEQNSMTDLNGRTIVYFTNSEVCHKLKCSHDKATKLFRELERFKLIHRLRQGKGKPDIIYVDNFIDSEKTSFKSAENTLCRVQKLSVPDCGKSAGNKTEFNNTDRSNTNLSIDYDEVEIKTIHQLAEKMIEEQLALNEIRQSTYDRKMETLKMLSDISDKQLAEVTEDEIIGFFKVKLDYSQSSINKMYQLLGAVFVKAISKKLIESNPLSDIKCPKSRKKQISVRALTVDEQIRLLNVLKKDSERIQREAKERFSMNPPQPYKEFQPLVIRANEGDEIQVNFYNKLDRRTSIHVQGLKYNVLTSDGAEVGYNPDTTTRDFISYKWYAEREGVYLFSDMGDTRSGEDGTNVHGLCGAIIIEPPASKYYHNILSIKKNYEEQSVITAPGVETFREFVLFAHNGIRLLDKKGNVIKTTEQGEEGAHGAPDHEDAGEKGYNYRSERFFNRLKRNPIISKIFSSRAHGDPSTPLLKAYAKERVIIRLLMPAVKPRNISFVLHGHNWRAQPEIRSQPLFLYREQ